MAKRNGGPIGPSGRFNRTALGRPIFGGAAGPTPPDAEEDDPALGADPSMGPQPEQMPALEPRAPGMSGLPDEDDIADEDLMTPEETMAKMADLLGLDPQDLGLPPKDHFENLAETLDDTELDKLGQDLQQMVEADLESRKPWNERFRRGLELVGLKDYTWDKGMEPFEGASNAVMPILAEAIVQSQARFMEEIFPAQGPVKTTVMGQETPQSRDAADRVQDHMNYQTTVEDQTYYMESEKLSMYLPIYGTGYRKAYHDYVLDQNLLRFVPGEDLILPYSARNAQEAPRRTHRFSVEYNEFKRGVVAGSYSDIDLPDPSIGAEEDEIDQERAKVDSKLKEEAPDDKNYTFYETDLYLEIPGDEDKDDAGNPTGVALPYTVTWEKESAKVLAIRRCWEEDDALKRMMTRYAEYWYLPGLGSYGFGLIHMIGTLAEAGTDALRALFDSATWANMQGGFKAKDANVKGGEMHMRPGVWLDVDMTADELGKAFHTPPVKEPSQTLFNILKFLTEQAQRFASTTDMMVGNQDAKGAPVGTTVALIEQGSKVYSGIHKRAHFAAGVEFRMLFKLNARFIPDGGYPYKVPGDDKAVYREDYDDTMVCVLPVSDPNIYSQTQRIALKQAEYQLAQDNPTYFRKGALLKSMLKAFREPDIDSILIDPDDLPYMDPVSENIAIATGRPVKAKDDESHDLHLITHMAFMQHPQFGGMPQAQQMIGPAMMAHIAEHLALKYASVMRGLGVQVPPINLMAENGSPIVQETGQQPSQIAMAAAQAVQGFLQSSGLTTTPPGQDPAQQEADDAHHESQVRQFVGIATGLMNLIKAGQTAQGGLATEAMVEGGGTPLGGGGPAPAMGAIPPAGPQPGPGALSAGRPMPRQLLSTRAPRPLLARPAVKTGALA